MGRLIIGVMAIGILGYLGFRMSRTPQNPAALETSAPKQRLDKVRVQAKHIEDQQEQAAESAFEKSETE